MSDIADRVKKIVVEHLGVEADKVSKTLPSLTILAPTAWTPSNW